MSPLLTSTFGFLIIALFSLAPGETETVNVPDDSGATRPAPAADLLDWVQINQSFQATRSEVTVKAYRACVEAGACDVPDDGGYCNWGRSDRDKHPINCVDWFQARQFASWVGGQLPSQSQWLEMAGSTVFPWGHSIPTCGHAAMTERVARCAGPGTSPVCSHPLGHSKDGLCDLAGNVWEWTDEGVSPPVNTAPEVLREQVAMGGAYYSMADELGRAGTLRRLPEDRGTGGIGFRVLRSLKAVE